MNTKVLNINSNLRVLYILNFLDLICSYTGLKYGYITETNPIMDSIYKYNPLFFVLFKALGTLLCILLINLLYDKKKWVPVTVFVLNMSYVYITFLHYSILKRI